MPNWVTDNNAENLTSSSIHQSTINGLSSSTNTTSAQDIDINMNSTNPATSSHDNATNGPPQQIHRSSSTVLLSPDTPPASAGILPQVQYPNPIPNQNSNTITNPLTNTTNMQTFPPQPPIHRVSQQGNNTPSNNSPAVNSIPLSKPQAAHHNSPNIYSFTIKGGQVATIQLTSDYAQKVHRLTMNNGLVQDMTTIEILRRYSTYLTASDLERTIKDPKSLSTLGQTILNSINGTAAQHGRQVSQPLAHHPRTSQNQQAGSSRPAPFVSSNGYSYVSQDNPAQIQQSIRNLENQTRPDSRQGIRNNARTGGTPAQSPTVPSNNPSQPPEIQAIQQDWTKELHAVEQTMGQGWEQLRAAAIAAFDKMGAVVAAKSTTDSETTINSLRSQLAEEQRRHQLSQSSVLRLTESESKVRSDLSEMAQRTQNEIDAKNSLQQQNNELKIQLAKSVSTYETEQAKLQAESTRVFELTNALKAQTERVSTLEANIAKLQTSHSNEVGNLKRELSEAIHKANQPIFGAAHTSPISPKSPADPASEIGKLKSLLKAKNVKFAELEEQTKKEKDDLSKECEKEVAMRIKQSEKVERLEKRIKDLEKQLVDVASHEKQKNNSDAKDEATIVLEKIVHWGENLQKKLGRSSTPSGSNDQNSSGNSSPVPVTNAASNGETVKKTLIERANSFNQDMASLAEKMLSSEKDRKEKMKKLQGQVELLKVQLTAAQSSSTPVSGTDMEELKSAFRKIVSWGENIQVLMGKTVEPASTDDETKPLEVADKFQKSMRSVFEEIQTKNKDQDQGQNQDQVKIKELEDKVKSLEKDLQANLDALFKKTSQHDDTTKLLEETKMKLIEVGNELKAKKEELKVKEEELRTKEEELSEKIKSHQSALDDMKTEYELDGNREERVKLVEQRDNLLKQRDSLLKVQVAERNTFALEKNTLSTEKAALERQLEEKTKLVSDRNSLSREKNYLSQENGTMKTQLDEQKSEIESLKKDLEDSKGSIDTAEAAMREAMNKQYEQREIHIETEKELKEVKEQKNKLTEKWKTLEAEIKLLKPKKASDDRNLKDTDKDDIQFIAAPGPSSQSVRKRPISSLFTPTPNSKNSISPSQSPSVRSSNLAPPQTPNTSSSQPSPITTTKRAAGTPLFLPNDEEEESQPSSNTLSQSVQRPKKRKKLMDDEDEDEIRSTPGPSSEAPSVAPSNQGSTASAATYKPVSKEWIQSNYHITTQKIGNKTYCKLCFVNEKKAAPPEKGKKMKVEDTEPLPIGINDAELLKHVSSHGEMLRRLKIKRVREGKEPASP